VDQVLYPALRADADPRPTSLDADPRPTSLDHDDDYDTIATETSLA
jgi:hypothetical protein